ncbi:MAG: hypothetical protein ACKOTB_12885 [Planctomycetia bacterium]
MLLVPAAAVRWRPRAELIHPDVRAEWAAEAEAAALGGPPARTAVWVVDGGFVRPLPVAVGPTDWTRTEISGAGLEAGMRVVVGEVRQAAAETVNPFTPKLAPATAPRK